MSDDRLEQRELEVAALDDVEVAAALEALLFASGQPEDVGTLALALGWPAREVEQGLVRLEAELRQSHRGLVLQRHGVHVQLVSDPRFGGAIARLLGMERTAKLSNAALETLALLAYRQPMTRGEIETIRGVDSSGVIATLVARELIEPLGRRPTPGNPVEFGTTASFLQFFGLTSLAELPPESDSDA